MFNFVRIWLKTLYPVTLLATYKYNGGGFASHNLHSGVGVAKPSDSDSRRATRASNRGAHRGVVGRVGRNLR
jgi:hypothetical protein